MKARFFLFIVSVFLFSCVHEDQRKVSFFKRKYDLVTGKDWDKIYLKNLIIENNVWAKEFLKNNFQIIFSKKDASEFGWYWEYAYTTKRISASPGIIIGKKPWLDTTTTELLPRPVYKVDSMICDFEYASNATGNFENSVMIWITDNKISKPNNIIFQLVCVFGDVGTDRLGRYMGTIQIDNKETDEYYYTSKDLSFKVAIFYLHTPNPVLHFNMANYLNYIIRKKYIKKTDFVSCLELATSPRWGIGESVIKNFNFSLKPL